MGIIVMPDETIGFICLAQSRLKAHLTAILAVVFFACSIGVCAAADEPLEQYAQRPKGYNHDQHWSLYY